MIEQGLTKHIGRERVDEPHIRPLQGGGTCQVVRAAAQQGLQRTVWLRHAIHQGFAQHPNRRVGCGLRRGCQAKHSSGMSSGFIAPVITATVSLMLIFLGFNTAARLPKRAT